MNKFLYSALALLLIASCRRQTTDLVFDKRPNERVYEKIDSVSTALKTASNGWKVFVETATGGDYSFFCNFIDDNNVSMLGDLNEVSGAKPSTSFYRVKQESGIMLIFDTYNYITSLSDNTSPYYGDGDLDYRFDYSNKDTMAFTGRQNGNRMFLIKATAEEKSTYDNGGLKNTMNKYNTFRAATKNLYMGIPGVDLGNKVAFTPDLATKKITWQYTDTSLGAHSVEGRFAFDLNGITFISPVKVEQYTFTGGVFNAAGGLDLFDAAGKKYAVSSTTDVVVPFGAAFFYDGSLRKIGTPRTGPANLPSIEVPSKFTKLFADVKAQFSAAGREIIYWEMRLIGTATVEFAIRYSSGASAFDAIFTFGYSINAGSLVTRNPRGNANWNNRKADANGAPLLALEAFITSTNTWRIAWVKSNEAVSVGGLYSSVNPDDIIYGYVSY